MSKNIETPNSIIEKIRKDKNVINTNGHSLNFNDFSSRDQIEKLIESHDYSYQFSMDKLQNETNLSDEELIKKSFKVLTKEIEYNYDLYKIFIANDPIKEEYPIFSGGIESYYNCDKCGQPVHIIYNPDTDEISLKSFMIKENNCILKYKDYKNEFEFKSTGKLILTNRFYINDIYDEFIDDGLSSLNGQYHEYAHLHKHGIFFSQTNAHSANLYTNNDRTEFHFVLPKDMPEHVECEEDYATYMHNGEKFKLLTSIYTTVWRYEFCDQTDYEKFKHEIERPDDIKEIEIVPGEYTYTLSNFEETNTTNDEDVKIHGILKIKKDGE